MTLCKLLVDYQHKALDLCDKHSVDFNTQYHLDLSPLGWHLGHCIHTETYWVRECLLDITSPDQKLNRYYIPELAHKHERGKFLSDYAKFYQWAKKRQQENMELIRNYEDSNNHPLMQHDFILHFLIQHYAQHFEIMHMVLSQKSLQKHVDYEVKTPLESSELTMIFSLLTAGYYDIGSQTDFLPYDNEYPCHKFKTDGVRISEQPVKNSEFLLFMEQSAYQNPKIWSLKGWRWRQKFDVNCPEFWLQDKRKNWFTVDITGAHDLDPEHPVWGLSYYEAEAFSNWVSLRHGQARLPHEYEWEAAQQNDCLKNTGMVWEWCQNSFHPYANFKAYPYQGYSTPYFDGKHFVMKGASRYTENVIKRKNFRNYYQADKRHQFAGCRLVMD